MMYKIARLQKFVGYNIMRSTKNVCVCVCVCVCIKQLMVT